MKTTRIAGTLGLAAILVATSGVAAHASTLTVTADKTTNLTRAGDSVAVTVTGTPTGQGVYIRFCQAPATAGARTAVCDAAHDIWATTDSSMFAYGGTPLTGALPLTVEQTFTSNGQTIDCAAVSCGIFVRRDHVGGGSDFTLDTFVPLTFAALPATATVTATRNSGRITVAVSNAAGRSIRVVIGSKSHTVRVSNDTQSLTFTSSKRHSTAVQVWLGNRRLVARTVTP